MNSLENDVLNATKGVSFPLVFNSFQSVFGDIYKTPEIKELFLDFLVKLIKMGELKLADSNGNFLNGTPEEQIDLFRQVWPDEYDPNIPEKDIDYLWWWVMAPAGAVWIYPDGFEEWT